MSSHKQAIAAENLQYSWDQNRVQNNDASAGLVVDIPELSLKQGQNLFVRGNSGSGKTTLFGLLAGTIAVQRGHLEVAGQNFQEASSAKRDSVRANLIGVLFQMFNLVPYLDATQNVLLALGFSKERAARVGHSETVQRDKAHALMASLGLQEKRIYSSKPSELSVGQQQRVAAARALIGEPQLILADEPTSALDDHAGGQFMKLLLKQVESSGASLVLASHDMRLSDHFKNTLDMSAKVERSGEAS